MNEPVAARLLTARPSKKYNFVLLSPSIFFLLLFSPSSVLRANRRVHHCVLSDDTDERRRRRRRRPEKITVNGKDKDLSFCDRTHHRFFCLRGEGKQKAEGRLHWDLQNSKQQMTVLLCKIYEALSRGRRKKWNSLFCLVPVEHICI